LANGEPRGWIYLGASAAAALLAFDAHAAAREADDEVEAARLDYGRAVSEPSLASARRRLSLALQDRRDHEEMRGLWVGCLAAGWVAAGLESWLLTAEPSIVASGGDRYVVVAPRAGRWSAAARSALVPGAGQRLLGHEARANLFTIAVCAFGAGAVLAQERFLDARRNQATKQHEFDRAETEAALDRARRALRRAADTVDDRNSIRWAWAAATAGVYGWNVLDAFAGGSQQGRAAVSATVTPEGEGLRAAVSWRVP
jgi:hypothetical protein